MLQKEADVYIGVTSEKPAAYRYCCITPQSKRLSGWINLDPDQSVLTSTAAGSEPSDSL